MRKSYKKVKQHEIIMDFVMDIDKLNLARFFCVQNDKARDLQTIINPLMRRKS